MPDIYQIPTELWHSILVQACTDGGYTGRSLALASRFFHGQSHRLRFYTLAITSLQRLEALNTFLLSQPVDFQPKIVHVYLSFTDEPYFNLFTATKSLLEDGSSAFIKLLVEGKTERTRWDERLFAASAGLLTRAASTLRTLCIAGAGPWPYDLGLPREFPKLEELSWAGYIPAIAPEGTTESPISLPRLRRLHFVLPYAGTHRTQPLSHVTTITSGTLTHLRISDVSYQDLGTPFTLGMLMRARCGWDPPSIASSAENDPLAPTPGVSSVAALPHLQHVIVHGVRPVFGRIDETSEWDEVSADLEMLGRECRKSCPDLLYVFVTREWGAKARWVDRLLDDWAARISGGSGCWVKSDAEEDALERV
ncbi:hypothetical protein BD413DRAFT_494422 [Trametes elegans]|nr:hypothetical protein BD413DRAFT_494422 [Trametes elegans]